MCIFKHIIIIIELSITLLGASRRFSFNAMKNDANF